MNKISSRTFPVHLPKMTQVMTKPGCKLLQVHLLTQTSLSQGGGAGSRLRSQVISGLGEEENAFEATPSSLREGAQNYCN